MYSLRLAIQFYQTRIFQIPLFANPFVYGDYYPIIHLKLHPTLDNFS